MPDAGRVSCIGCGGLVPDVDGPLHRYMLASPGCWAAYTGLLVGPTETNVAGLAGPHRSLRGAALRARHRTDAAGPSGHGGEAGYATLAPR